MAARSDSNPIDNLEVTIKQTNDSPLTITATVTNKNQHPVAVLKYNSPLDSLAFKLGLISITPDGASEPLNWPTIQIRRVWPPRADSFVHLEPGASHSSEITVEDRFTSEDRIGKKAAVELKGRWDMVWNKSKDNITEEELDNTDSNPNVFNGDYSSNIVEIIGRQKLHEDDL
ncbi:putative secreted protein [Cladobotryum mycophilum]|uniref:Secreted protein n=1 Tax=Cladobotryum mycophilum TaxID=491253 RepID=A0ABR0STB6_9HYPO